ncbi:MAG: hypothetical protein R3247_10785 [Rhodothermales bacterium]|nr:hypothetical protein [Rhodothermales bacterium]
MLYRVVLLGLLLTPGLARAQNAALDYVELSDGTRYEGATHIGHDGDRFYVLLHDSTRYALDLVRRLESGGAHYYVVSHLEGQGAARSARPVLVQRRIEGRVAVYSRVRPPLAQTRRVRYDFYGMGEDAPLRVAPAYLRQDLADHAPSMAALRQAEVYRYGGHTLAAAGLLVVFWGLTRSVDYQPGRLGRMERHVDLDARVWIGAGVSASAWMPYRLADARIRRAIALYNAH